MDKTELFVAMQNKWIELHNLKNGDKVKVVKGYDPKDNKISGCLTNNVTLHLNDLIFEIKDFLGTSYDSMKYGIQIANNTTRYNIPYFCLEPVKEDPIYYRIGQRFSAYNSEYMIVSTSDFFVTLIDIEDGARIPTNPVNISSCFKISQTEFKELTGKLNPENFKLIQ